ncbi:helix-turn-helix transcriptional regulator [Ruminococcaceae bacterium OttesenSCG-928-A11]|nr:helix-turn-helix transcriptional regulator [Ruminococcaceae bacterium OttesenSCG-928-A11]
MRQYLLDLRENRKMSQQDVAQLAGITQAYYCFIEQGKRQRAMSMATLQKLAMAFSLQPSDIFQMETEYQQTHRKVG